MDDSETLETLGDKYRSLDRPLPARGVEAIDTGCLLTFPYPEDGAPQEVVVDTDEFTALCPWTGLPDYGKLVVCYTPDRCCLEPLLLVWRGTRLWMVDHAGTNRVDRCRPGCGRAVDGSICATEEPSSADLN